MVRRRMLDGNYDIVDHINLDIIVIIRSNLTSSVRQRIYIWSIQTTKSLSLIQISPVCTAFGAVEA